ncbi:MAG: Wzz/FepE/Etk N-terminal domain-containing protein [Candidatus Electryoneaceae bacterium]|nr:Wzz/FepE/Etk N-terminal domain-containing protein [Candidatus Electryoneaceae bacterium]
MTKYWHTSRMIRFTASANTHHSMRLLHHFVPRKDSELFLARTELTSYRIDMADNESSTEKRESVIKLNVYDLLLVLVKWRKLFIVNFLIVVTAAVVIALTLPVWYSATVVILPPSGGAGGMASFLPKNLAGLAVNFGMEASDNNIYYSILASRTLRERIIEQFDLRQVYKMDEEAFPEDLLDAFDSHLTITPREDQAILVTMEDHDPQRAADMPNAIAAEMDVIYRGLVSETARQTRIFIENRLNNIADSLGILEDSLSAFQLQTGAISIEVQTAAMIKAAAEVKAQKMESDIQLAVLQQTFSGDHPMILQLQRTSRQLEIKYEEIVGGMDGDLFLGLPELPELSRQYTDLYRKVMIQQTLMEYIFPQYENARIQEERETTNVQVLDHARVPYRKSRPLRKRLVLIATAASIFVTMILVLGMEYWRALPDKSPEDWAKVQGMLQNLRQRKV